MRGSDAPRVLLIDDHVLVASSLVLALRGAGYDAGHCAPKSRDDVFDAAARLSPGVVLLDLDLGTTAEGELLDGTEFVGPLRALGWSVVLLTGNVDRERIAACIVAGAEGWVGKATAFDLLERTVSAAVAGEPVISAAERAELLEVYRAAVFRRRAEEAGLAEARTRLARLSAREREVLELLAEGVQAGGIAAGFVVSVATVRAQIRSVLTKLDVGSQLAAVALLRRTQH